jgi:hypothetical protein
VYQLSVCPFYVSRLDSLNSPKDRSWARTGLWSWSCSGPVLHLPKDRTGPIVRSLVLTKRSKTGPDRTAETLGVAPCFILSSSAWNHRPYISPVLLLFYLCHSCSVLVVTVILTLTYGSQNLASNTTNNNTSVILQSNNTDCLVLC